MEQIKLTPEELAAEQAAMAEAKEEEVRAKVVEEFGFDPEVEADKIAVAVEREMKYRNDFGHLLRQKKKIREERNELLTKVPPKETPPAPAVDAATVTAEVTKALEQRDLEDLGLPSEVEAEVKKLAALQGVSVKKAAKDPYIAHLTEQHKATQKEEDAAIKRKNKGGGATQPFDPKSPPDVDMKTPEGQKAFNEWKEEAKRRGL